MVTDGSAGTISTKRLSPWSLAALSGCLLAGFWTRKSKHHFVALPRLDGCGRSFAFVCFFFFSFAHRFKVCDSALDLQAFLKWLTGPHFNCPTTWFLRKAAASPLEHGLVCRFVRSVVAFWFATPRTPPLWQRGFPLVECFVLRRFLTSERSGVVKTFRCAATHRTSNHGNHL